MEENEGRRQQRPLNTIKSDYDGKIPNSLSGKLRASLMQHCKISIDTNVTSDTYGSPFSGELPFTTSNEVIEHNEDEYLDLQAIRVTFLQFFIDIFRNYRLFLTYRERSTLRMEFDDKEFLFCLPENQRMFVCAFLQTLAFTNFIEQRCAADVIKHDFDIVTFDYCIALTMDASCAVSHSNVSEFLNKYTGGSSLRDDDSTSSTTTTTNISSDNRSGKSGSAVLNNFISKTKVKKKKNIYKSLQTDLITQLWELQLEDPYLEFIQFVTKAADEDPTKEELTLG